MPIASADKLPPDAKKTYLGRAKAFATMAHGGQTRVGSHDPYILHPTRVALYAHIMGLSLDAVAAAYLHDVLEDTPTMAADLFAFDFTARTVWLVEALTKPRQRGALPPEMAKALKDSYYSIILDDAEAVAIKLLDRGDNCSELSKVLPEIDRRRAERYYATTKTEFLLLRSACKNVYVVDLFDEGIRRLEKALV